MRKPYNTLMDNSLKARIEKEKAEKERAATEAAVIASGAAETQFRLLYDEVCRDVAKANAQYGFEKVKVESVSPRGFTLTTDSAQLDVMLQPAPEVMLFHKQTERAEKIPMFVSPQGTIHFGSSIRQQIPIDHLASKTVEYVLF